MKVLCVHLLRLLDVCIVCICSRYWEGCCVAVTPSSASGFMVMAHAWSFRYYKRYLEDRSLVLLCPEPKAGRLVYIWVGLLERSFLQDLSTQLRAWLFICSPFYRIYNVYLTRDSTGLLTWLSPLVRRTLSLYDICPILTSCEFKSFCPFSQSLVAWPTSLEL